MTVLAPTDLARDPAGAILKALQQLSPAPALPLPLSRA